MKSPRIYQDISLNAEGDIELDNNASHHLTRVLRLKNEDNITLFNGDGYEYSAVLSLQEKKVFARINKTAKPDRESNLHITLLQGISKGDRMDMCMQKAVELGVNKIIPVICQRTVVNLKAERGEKKLRHWQGIIISACEQSGRNILPELTTHRTLKDALQQSLNGLRLTLDPNANTGLSSYKPDTNEITLLIGPEGGLTQDEIELSLQNQFNTALLGKRILRTETAAIAAISTLQTLWGDFSNPKFDH
jgi:16S rRNA (uracil1498-N3)-methyltransferase